MAIVFIGILFFIFGFITWANSQLIPYFKLACELSDTQSYLVATAFFAAYFLMAIPSSMVLARSGLKAGISLGLGVMSAGAAIFIPAALTRSYPMFLTGLFVIGSGLALLQTAANPYVTILGPIEKAAQRISIMGICNKVAGILAVYVLGSITLSNADEIKAKLVTQTLAERTVELDALIRKVLLPYGLISALLAILAVVFFKLRLPEVKLNETGNDEMGAIKATDERKDIAEFPYVWLGALAIFFYVGAEVISYDTFSSFGEYLGFPLSTAKNFASFTGYALLAGYVLGIVAIPRFISQRNALLACGVASIALVVLSMFTQGYTAVVCFALLGLTNSVMWPAIWPLGIERLGKFTEKGSALLIMGIVGGAVLPPLYGYLSTALGSKQLGYSLMLVAYLYIIYFALHGHRIGKRGH